MSPRLRKSSEVFSLTGAGSRHEGVNSRCGEPVGEGERGPFPLPFLFGSCLNAHASPNEHWPFVVQRMEPPLSELFFGIVFVAFSFCLSFAWSFHCRSVVQRKEERVHWKDRGNTHQKTRGPSSNFYPFQMFQNTRTSLFKRSWRRAWPVVAGGERSDKMLLHPTSSRMCCSLGRVGGLKKGERQVPATFAPTSDTAPINLRVPP